VQWEAEWRGRAQELDALDSGRTDTPERIENTIVNALFSNRRIALTEGDIVQIRALCVTDRCRRNVDALTPSRATPIN
jgi:hypothetical protein